MSRLVLQRDSIYSLECICSRSHEEVGGLLALWRVPSYQGCMHRDELIGISSPINMMSIIRVYSSFQLSLLKLIPAVAILATSPQCSGFQNEVLKHTHTHRAFTFDMPWTAQWLNHFLMSMWLIHLPLMFQSYYLLKPVYHASCPGSYIAAMLFPTRSQAQWLSSFSRHGGSPPSSLPPCLLHRNPQRPSPLFTNQKQLWVGSLSVLPVDSHVNSFGGPNEYNTSGFRPSPYHLAQCWSGLHAQMSLLTFAEAASVPSGNVPPSW